MSSGPFIERQKSESLDIPPRRVEITDPSQLPNDFSTTPGGTIFSTTPGGMFFNFLFLNDRLKIIYVSYSCFCTITQAFSVSLMGCVLKHVLSWLTRDLIFYIRSFAFYAFYLHC